MKKKVIAMLAIIALLVGIAPSAALASPFSERLTKPTSGDYYYNNSFNPFPSKGANCTWYAWGRAYEITGKRPNLSTGNANSWYDYNKNNGV
ncbi:MAG: hypothetical protein LBT59_18580, partial [Clostridiales bacterium]|nr:hypothetical protein [Clostridiales bacterium]